jgi:hypothetical protein
MKRFAAFVVLAGLFVVARAPAAHACSCALRPVDDVVGVADAALVGTVARVPDISGIRNSASPVTWTFRVGWVVKGDLPRVVDVSSSAFGAPCGIERLEQARRVALALHRDRSKGWTSGLCDELDPAAVRAMPGRRPHAVDRADVDRAVPGGTSVPASPARDLRNAWPFVVVGAGLAVGLLLTAVVWQRRRAAHQPD